MHVKHQMIVYHHCSLTILRSPHLECQGVPDGLSRFWAGHAAKDVHQSYVRLGENLEVRKFWAEKAGIGFEL